MEAFQTDAGIVETVDSGDEVMAASVMTVQQWRGTCSTLLCVSRAFPEFRCLRPLHLISYDHCRDACPSNSIHGPH